MAIEIYKKGQAALTRYIAAGACAAMIGWGSYTVFKWLYIEGWLRTELLDIPGVGFAVTPALLIAIAVFVAACFGVFLILNRPATADLLIDTELEMKKVSWPTRQEAWNSTIVVIVTVVIFTILLFTFDVLLSQILKLVFGSGA
jgi:preprotein translocase subunit SecE